MANKAVRGAPGMGEANEMAAGPESEDCRRPPAGIESAMVFRSAVDWWYYAVIIGVLAILTHAASRVAGIGNAVLIWAVLGALPSSP